MRPFCLDMSFFYAKMLPGATAEPEVSWEPGCAGCRIPQPLPLPRIPASERSTTRAES